MRVACLSQAAVFLALLMDGLAGVDISVIL